eukprot:3004653-Prymnesium_polylepis.1
MSLIACPRLWAWSRLSPVPVSVPESLGTSCTSTKSHDPMSIQVSVLRSMLGRDTGHQQRGGEACTTTRHHTQSILEANTNE